MHDLFNYLAEMPTVHKLLWLIACLGSATLAELLIPLRPRTYSWLRHFRTNGSLLFTTLLINALSTFVVLLAAAWAANHQFGLLNAIALPQWLEFLIALIVIDLVAQYFIHYLLHQVPFLWRFHKVHHSDTHVDATTGTRHHPVDYFFRELFSLIVVIALGMPPEFYALYRILTIFCTYFTHANIRLPDALDRALSWVIVTPNAHKFHHHDLIPWTDRNYGNIFVFWDRIFGTFVYESTDKISYGVDTMNPQYANSLAYQLKIPFTRTVRVRPLQ